MRRELGRREADCAVVIPTPSHEFRANGLTVPIIRPKSFIGPERLGVFALFSDWAKDGHGFPRIGSGSNRYQLCDVEDVCQGIYLCVTGAKDQVDDVFNIGAREFTTMKEDYQAVLDEAGFGEKIRGFPAAPVIWTLRVLEALELSHLVPWKQGILKVAKLFSWGGSRTSRPTSASIGRCWCSSSRTGRSDRAQRVPPSTADQPMDSSRSGLSRPSRASG
jgi:hypothetical protein